MDNFENEELCGGEKYAPERNQEEQIPEEQVTQPETAAPEETAASPYRGSGVGRRESPFADSPYVMKHAPQTEPAVEPKTVAPKAAKKKSNRVFKRALAAVLILALVAGSCGITAAVVNDRWENETAVMYDDLNTRMIELQNQLDQAKAASGSIIPGAVQGMTPGQVYAQNVRSVVLITCEVTANVYGQAATGTSAGSGFILTENGYVATNAHVVEGASKITVSTVDGMEYTAKLIGSDATNDLAVLKVEAEGLAPVTIGSSANLAVGDQVVAIGNPLGELTSTMTAGYVSAKNRDVTTDGRTINMIQTDAAINSGNSGGPLFNMLGQVVGITTAKYSGSSASGASIEGIGFAIPMDDVIGMMDDLVNYGYVTGAYLGVMVSDMDAEAAAYYGMPVGAYVQEVTRGHCAERAGLQEKDIIVALGQYQVRNVSMLTRALRNFKAGETTTITVFRGGSELVLSITLDEKPSTTTQPETQWPNEAEMPEEGSFEEWYNYFAPFFGQNQDKED